MSMPKSFLLIAHFAEEQNGNLSAQIGSPLLPEPASSSQFALLNEWLYVCRETHNHGHSTGRPSNDIHKVLPEELPTRVVDVGSHDHPRLQLIDSESMRSQEYMAFSHCWGEGPLFSTLTSTIHELRQGFDINLLPRSFQDAITVARGLNMTYLWIDSLCIIQDDMQDWENEAARMQQVFSNAICVIAASSAPESSAGFLSIPRQQRTWATLQPQSNERRRHVCKFIDNFHGDVEESVLNQRGWVLQERALARRLIHFTSTQIYMECGHGVYCESLMKLIK